ncbi:MAG TPA: hypothetical protein VM925_31880 [Labilithrix sp.]|nr:hypothetical protein [Labilithrix sp.]
MSRNASAQDVAAGSTPAPGPSRTSGAPTSGDRPVDAEITSDTAAQFYEMRSPTGQTIIARRRLTTTLGVAVYDLFDKVDDPRAPTLTFRARLRYDADYGASAEETALSRTDRFVPGFSRGPVDLMYGYIEGRRFARGLLGFRLGRQYVTDALGWWSFDGGLVKVTTPYYFALEAYGGLEQRGGLPLSTSRFERDGIWRGDRSGYERDPTLYPSFQPNAIAPAIGGAIETAGFNWLHGRLTYRRVYNTGGSNVSQFENGLRAPATYDGSRISQERVGYAVDGTLPTLGGVKAGFAYDLYVAQMANIFASLDWYASPKVTVSLDYDYYRPTFDGDSIWNFFMAMPMNDLGLRASWDPTRRLGVSGGVRARAFMVQTEAEKGLSAETSPNGLALANDYPSSAIDPMGGANVAGRYRIGEGFIGARGAADVHSSGDRIGLDVYGERTLETRYVLQARTGVWHWSDELRADRDATNFGYVLGAGYKLFPRSLVLADFQHDMNRIAGQRFRAMLWLTVAIAK